MNPLADFPWFYQNPAIQTLGQRRAWTFSERNDNPKYDKRPIDVQMFLRSGHFRGASFNRTDSELLTLPELTGALPYLANLALYSNVDLTNLLVLDIEKTCPPDLRDHLLTLAVPTADRPAVALYAETSLSGLGYHLVMPLPSNYYHEDLAGARTKPKVQAADKSFEILSRHWSTFTRNPISGDVMDRVIARAATDPADWDTVYHDLCISVRPAKQYSDIDPAKLLELLVSNNIAYQDCIVPISDNFEVTYPKTIADFNNDLSRWEYSMINHIIGQVRRYITTHRWTTTGTKPLPSTEDLVLLVYAIAARSIPHRAKHDGDRSGMPFLLYQTRSAVEHSDLSAITDDSRDDNTRAEQIMEQAQVESPPASASVTTAGTRATDGTPTPQAPGGLTPELLALSESMHHTRATMPLVITPATSTDLNPPLGSIDLDDEFEYINEQPFNNDFYPKDAR